MVATLTFNGRLPGVLCETTVPSPAQNRLRLDVAGFVGFAERGPVDVPVLIEDLSQYTRLFGGDLPLALDEGRPVYAHLRSAVDAFFENGGQRCYVVRVAGAGRRANRFQIAGLLSAGDGWQPVTVPAAWLGRWSDFVTTGAALRTRSLTIRTDGLTTLAGSAVNAGTFSLDLRTLAADTVRSGDLLRLHLGRENEEGRLVKHHLVYVRADAVSTTPTPTAELLGVPITVQPDGAALHRFTVEPGAAFPDRVERLAVDGWQLLPADPASVQWRVSSGAEPFRRLTFELPAAEALSLALEAGDLLRLAGPGDNVTFVLADRVIRGSEESAPDRVQLGVDSREPLRWLDALPEENFVLMQVDRVGFDLTVREGEEVQEVWRDLRFSPGANEWRSVLMSAIDMARSEPAAFQIDDFSGRSLRLGRPVPEPQALLLPIGMGATPRYLGPLPDPQTAGKDGLDSFDPVALFADEALLTVGVRNLMREANDLLYLAPETRRLRGLHSLLPVSEVALLSMPDLAHAGWLAPEQPLFTEPVEPEPPAEEPHGFHDCPPDEAGEMPTEDPCTPAMPVITLPDNGTVTWPSIQAQLEGLPDQLPPVEHDGAALLAVQRLLIRACAARADMVALLSLPQHYTGRVIEQWRDELAATPDLQEDQPLSYAAVYHPWTGVREGTTPSLAPLRYVPPDGSVAGMIAAREQRRGPWIAPANVALRTVADLAPDLTDGEWAPLYNRQINVLRRQPGRFTAMSALTQAGDVTLAQLSVRRLLIFLRKLALREGQRYVFESNTARFRTLVQTYFENVLDQLLAQGGIRAYQVVTGPELNTQNDYDNGRFLIALKVAPTLPIEFITIIMLRSGDDGIDILEV